MVRDPVCGMIIKKKDAEAMAEYKGKTYYFHTIDCNAEFAESPDKYVREDVKPIRTKKADKRR